VIDDDGRVIVSAPKTASSKRTVHLSPESMQLLPAYRERQAQQREMLKGRWRESGRGFTNIYSGTLLPNNMKRSMVRICEAASVRTLPVHGLRHTYASLSLRRGIPAEWALRLSDLLK